MKSEKLKSPTLDAAYSEAMDQMYAGLDAFPWTDRAAYGAFLAQTYHMTKYTTRLASLTAGSFSIAEETMHQKGLAHLREETGHERLALNDLRGIGFNIDPFPEMMEVTSMILSQYHFIQRHPAAHFGFVLPLETMACTRGPELTEITRAAYGDGANAFIRVHTEVDKHHVGEMIKLINMSPDWVLEHTLVNLRQTGYLYSQMLAKAAAFKGQRVPRAA